MRERRVGLHRHGPPKMRRRPGGPHVPQTPPGSLHVARRVRRTVGPVLGDLQARRGTRDLARGRSRLEKRRVKRNSESAGSATRLGRRHRRVQNNHVEQAISDVPGDQDQQGVREGALGRATAGVGLFEEPESREGEHTEREAGAQEYHQFVVRSADRVSDLRFAVDDQLC